MARKGGPALYELMSRGRASADPAGAPAPTGAKPRAGGLQPFGGSDAKWLAWTSVFAVALVLAYFVGVTRGERLGRAQAVAEREDELRLLSEARPAVAQPPASEERARAQQVGSENQASRADRAPAAETQPPLDPNYPPLPPAAEGVDPRQSGLNYFIIASTVEANAREIARFCRERGLDAHVVAGDNRSLREVIVLPGFPRSELSGPGATQTRQRIRAVGVLHKAAARGNSDFSDMYPKLYQR